MKIKFLGTSYGAPSKDRHQQSFLIEENEDLYIFDTGAPVLDILIKCGYNLRKGVFRVSENVKTRLVLRADLFLEGFENGL